MSECGDNPDVDIYVEARGFCRYHTKEIIKVAMEAAGTALKAYCEANGFDIDREGPSLHEVATEALGMPEAKD